VDAQPLAGVEGIGNRFGDNLDESVVEVSDDDMEIFSSCHHPLLADRSRRSPVDRRPNGKRALLLYRPGRAKLEAFYAPGLSRPRTTGNKKAARRPLSPFNALPFQEAVRSG